MKFPGMAILQIDDADKELGGHHAAIRRLNPRYEDDPSNHTAL